MDWLHDVREHLERAVFGQVANLLNLEVDLLFFDTTSTYFELEDPDEPVARDEHGHPLPDHRDDNAARTARTARTPRTRRTGRVPDLRQVEGLPRRPPADRDRDGGHPRRDPGAGVVLARQHRRLRADPPGQRRHAGLDPVEDRVGRRPRVLLRAQPPLPAPGRSRLHHRREAALRLPGDQGRPVAAGPLHRHRREHAGQGGEGLRHRAVRDLPQPRRRAARRPHPRAVGRPARGADRRVGHAAGDEARRAAREDLDQARPEPLPAGHPRRAAPHRQGQDQN